MDIGKFKNHQVESKTISMTSAVQAQSEVQIPNYGDIAAIGLTISQSTTGTLSSANTLDHAIAGLTIKDKSGTQLMQGIIGTDLLMLERFRNKGVNRTIATTSGSAQTETFFIPLNIEISEQEIRAQVSIAPYSDMATSGATGGSITYSLVVYYYGKTEKTYTEKIQKFAKTANIGINTFGTDLPKNILITDILFKCTEGYLTSIRFSSDGSKELDSVSVAHLTSIDNAILVSGHVTGQLKLYNAPFKSSSASALDFTNGTADTITFYIIGSAY